MNLNGLKFDLKKAIAILSILATLYGIGLASWIEWQTALAREQAPTPEAILMLGGNHDREVFTARFARQHDLPLDIWVSSGLGRQQASQIFRAAGIAEERVHLDYQAVDTVTNFSTLVRQLKEQQIRHVYLITSDYHMARSQAIASIILGSQGIAFTPVEVPSPATQESPIRIARDVARSVFWTLTGHTAATLNPQYDKLRLKANENAKDMVSSSFIALGRV
ncbi:YdcF family protein [Roseofilum casamattae]|uniref:YdcF family protein n=1 Tax=Roseofilum casamattae BLCC-M143 TaxID=3022442 RepID=A0ABT7BYY1_9CYAN|nr:YdcF family protein [Roseofilum casamattae]MDJ1184366.1 YdcF family protein [Roseofilum casamattae BLCC-M143]